MRDHAQRIQRIQELCAHLDTAIKDSRNVQETVEQLETESGLLLRDLRNNSKGRAEDAAAETRSRAGARDARR